MFFFGFAHIAALCCCCCVVRLAVVVARLFALLLRWGRAMDIFISQGSVSGPPVINPLRWGLVTDGGWDRGDWCTHTWCTNPPCVNLTAFALSFMGVW